MWFGSESEALDPFALGMKASGTHPGSACLIHLAPFCIFCGSQSFLSLNCVETFYRAHTFLILENPHLGFLFTLASTKHVALSTHE